MPNGVVPALVRTVVQAAQREGFRRREIAHAMLMMDRERGARFTSDVARTPRTSRIWRQQRAA